MVEIGAPDRGIWEETIGIAFAQAWTFGTTGVIADVRSSEPKDGITWVGEVAIHDQNSSDVRAQRYRLSETAHLVIRYTAGKVGRFSANRLRLLDTRELGIVVVRHLVDKLGGTWDFSGDVLTEHVGEVRGTADEARDLADKAIARALIRSSIDNPGSSAVVTLGDLVESFRFLDMPQQDRWVS